MRTPVLVLCLCMLLCYGCGGGGSDGNPARAPAKAALSFSTALAAGNTDTFGSVEFTVDLPAGVTVPVDSKGVISAAALVLVDKALAVSTQMVLGTYMPPGNGLPATVHIGIVTLNAAGNGTGMYPGKFATLSCDITQGTSLSAAIFSQPNNVIITDPAGSILPAPEAQVSLVTILQ